MNQQTDLTCAGLLETGEVRPLAVALDLGSNSAPACELMFFCGAPFAHVVQYEDHVRTKRKGHESRALLRSQRPRRWRGFEDMISPSLVDAYVRQTPAG
jgi:hypothetical protein